MLLCHKMPGLQFELRWVKSFALRGTLALAKVVKYTDTQIVCTNSKHIPLAWLGIGHVNNFL